MPSPIGHALAGAAIALVADSLQKDRRDSQPRAKLVAICIGLALAPDLDFVYPPIHRTMTHSIVAVVLALAAAAVISRRRSVASVWHMALTCGCAYGSHLLLDWLGDDGNLPSGVQLLWPFRNTWYISEWHVFRATVRSEFFQPSTLLANMRAVVQEILILAPIATCAWLLRRDPRGAGSLNADGPTQDNPSP